MSSVSQRGALGPALGSQPGTRALGSPAWQRGAGILPRARPGAQRPRSAGRGTRERRDLSTGGMWGISWGWAGAALAPPVSSCGSSPAVTVARRGRGCSCRLRGSPTLGCHRHEPGAGPGLGTAGADFLQRGAWADTSQHRERQEAGDNGAAVARGLPVRVWYGSGMWLVDGLELLRGLGQRLCSRADPEQSPRCPYVV